MGPIGSAVLRVLDTNKQTNQQTPRQAKFIYRYIDIYIIYMSALAGKTAGPIFLREPIVNPLFYNKKYFFSKFIWARSVQPFRLLLDIIYVDL